MCVKRVHICRTNPKNVVYSTYTVQQTDPGFWLFFPPLFSSIGSSGPTQVLFPLSLAIGSCGPTQVLIPLSLTIGSFSPSLWL